MGGERHVAADGEQLGFVDHLSVGYSFNSQREGRVNQGGNGNPLAAINHEFERTTVHGVQAHAIRQLGRHLLGGGIDAYFEKVKAPSVAENATTGATTVRRGRVPDGATYDTTGIYLNDQFEIGSRLTLGANLRYSSFQYESRASNSPLSTPAPLAR